MWQWVDIWNCLYRERIIFLSKPVDEELGNQVIPGWGAEAAKWYLPGRAGAAVFGWAGAAISGRLGQYSMGDFVGGCPGEELVRGGVEGCSPAM